MKTVADTESVAPIAWSLIFKKTPRITAFAGITSVFLIKLDDDVPNPTQSRLPIDWSVDK